MNQIKNKSIMQRARQAAELISDYIQELNTQRQIKELSNKSDLEALEEYDTKQGARYERVSRVKITA